MTQSSHYLDAPIDVLDSSCLPDDNQKFEDRENQHIATILTPARKQRTNYEGKK